MRLLPRICIIIKSPAGKVNYFLNYTGPAHLRRFRRQYATPVRVLTAVAASAGPTMADGLTLPYWLR